MELFTQAAIGFLAGLLGGLLGIGGSVIIIPALIIYLSHTGGYGGSSQHLLQAAAMICNVFVAAPAVVAHWRARAIMKSLVVFLIPSALVGIFLGVTLSNSSSFARENGTYLAMILAGFLVYVAGYNTWRLFDKTDLGRHFDQRPKPPAWSVIAVGIPMGFTAGLLGIGGGAICVPLQQILLKVPLRRAIANSATTIVCVSAIGAMYKNFTLPDHGVAVSSSLRLAAMLIPTAIVGSYLGGKLTHALPRKVLRLVFIVFMTTIAYLTFSRAWQAATTENRSQLPCPQETNRRQAASHDVASWPDRRPAPR